MFFKFYLAPVCKRVAFFVGAGKSVRILKGAVYLAQKKPPEKNQRAFCVKVCQETRARPSALRPEASWGVSAARAEDSRGFRR